MFECVKTTYKNHIEKRFSSAAFTYDAANDIQLMVADHLQKMASHFMTKLEKAELAIDIGCGTGLMTEKMLVLFPVLEIVGLDIAEQMISLFNQKFLGKNNVRAITTDFLQFEYSKAFDLAFSSSALHWILPLESAITKVHSILRERALFLAGMTVAGTFRDFLRLKEKIAPAKAHNTQFTSYLAVMQILKENGFHILEAEEKSFIVQYNSTREFIMKLHQQGTTAATSGTPHLNRRELEMLMMLYDKEHSNTEGKIEINYEILFFCAEKL